MDVVSDTFDVTYRGIDYSFKIPTPFDLIKVAKRAQMLRADAGDGYGDAFGLDNFSMRVVNGMAVFDVLLRKCSHPWPFGDVDGKPVVDSKAFRPNKSLTVVAVYDLYNTEVARFLEDGDGRADPDPAKSVAGSNDPGA